MTNFDKTEIDQAVKKVVNEYGDTLKMLGGKTDNFDKTLDEGLKDLEKIPQNVHAPYFEKQGCISILLVKHFLTTFAHKIREAVEKDNK